MVSDRFLRSSITRSPHSVDPLSWFIRPFLPLTFALAMALGGAAFVAGTLREFDSPQHQAIAVLCFVLACLTIHRRAKPRLNPFLLRHAVLPLALAWVGVVVSGVGASQSDGDISRWWAPLGVALVLAALAPFNSAVLLVGFGLLSTVVCSVVAVLAFERSPDGWPLLTTIVLATLVPLQATVATAMFSAFIVDRVLRWSSLPIQGALSSNRALDFSQWNAQSDELKLLSDRVVPFLSQMADDGFVAVRDRTLAAELAREVRDALLKTVDRSWLDSLAADHGLQVIDPRNRAVRLTHAQRGAVRSLIVAVLESSALVPDTLSIELRDSADGGVAVGLTMRLDLPEGKRMMLLAPYYLTLRATVDDLTWDDQDQLNLRFRIPAPERNRD
ncbi:MAG TPA: hypothetical protein VFT01_09230 [Homoserinimonas sp.]|nr:hypothetical protein [Homoserinimonas sp.]